MAKGYWMIGLDVVDTLGYMRYTDMAAPIYKAHGARYLVRGGDFEQLEGIKRHRNVVIEFPTFEAALACYRSPEYQEAARYRAPYAIVDQVALEGYEGPQPRRMPPRPQPGRPLGYWLARVDVDDPKLYPGYMAANAAPFAEFGAWFVARGGRYQQLEGKGRARHVILAFDDVETARGCYHSPGYQKALAIRRAASVADICLVAGAEGEAPAAN